MKRIDNRNIFTYVSTIHPDGFYLCFHINITAENLLSSFYWRKDESWKRINNRSISVYLGFSHVLERLKINLVTAENLSLAKTISSFLGLTSSSHFSEISSVHSQTRILPLQRRKEVRQYYEDGGRL